MKHFSLSRLGLNGLVSLILYIFSVQVHASEYKALVDSPLVASRLALIENSVYKLIGQDATLPTETRSAVLATFSATFEQESMKVEIQERLEFELEAHQAKSIRQWFEQGLGVEIIKLEKRSLNPAAANTAYTTSNMGSSAQVTPVNEATENVRKIRIRQLDTYLGYTQLQVSLLDSLKKLVGLALSAEMGQSPYLETINNILGTVIASSQQVIQYRSEAFLKKVYAPLTPDEMKVFVEYMDEPTSRAFNQVMIDVLHETLLATITLVANKSLNQP